MEHSPNSWKLWRRNFGQARRKWTLALLPVFFPLAMRTGATPVKFNKSPATSKRPRSVPKAVNNRGPSAGPAPGKLSNRKRSG